MPKAMAPFWARISTDLVIGFIKTATRALISKAKDRLLNPLILCVIWIVLLPVRGWSGDVPSDEYGPFQRRTAAESPLPEAGNTNEPSLYDRIWHLATLFEDRNHPLVQKIALTGRYHGQYAAIDGNGREWDRWENRRVRIGVRGDFLREFSFDVQMDLSPDSGPTYAGLTDAFFEWRPKSLRARFGKQMLEYTYEGSISSNEILTTERSLITETVWKTPEYMTGATVSGEAGPWSFAAGVFAGDQQKEFSRLDAGYGGLLKAGYDFGPKIGLKKLLFRADYFYNDSNRANNVFRDFQHTGSFSLQLQQGRAGVNTDFLAARGIARQSDVFGLILMPFYDLTDRLQAIFRYTLARSAHPNGLALLRRYEQKVSGGRGDEYHAFYLGLNYYLYGHKLKLMGSLEYSNMHSRAKDGTDFAGWTYITAVRLNF
jgi:phosphate-selective porin OprO/OprP